MSSLYLLIAAVLGPLVVGGLAVGVEELRLHSAVGKAAAQARADCVAQARAQTAEALLAQFEEARQAELGIGPTPVDRAQLQALCNGDVNCRERGK